jgi:RNA polymerase sigma-70 factor (ECF subfamily)
MENEKNLVERTLAGDETAFAALVEAYQAPVFNLCYRLLGERGEAEDAAQETFLRIYTRLNTYEPERKLSSWVLSIASHYCIDRLRRRHGTTVSADDIVMGNMLASTEDGPEKTALQGEDERTMQRLLQALPAEYRLALTLRYWQDMSYQEMATMVGISEAAIKSRLHRARCMMAEQLKNQPAALVAAARPLRQTHAAAFAV